MVELIPPAALVDRLPALDADGRIAAPIRLVDLDEAVSPAVAGEAARAAGSATGVVVGVCLRGAPAPSLARLVAALDLTFTPVRGGADTVAVPDVLAAARGLEAIVSAFPQAATVLAGLLRWSAALPVPAALDAESLAYSALLGGPEFAGWLARRGARPVPPPAADPVLLERTGGQLRITLNRPERRNAYGRQLRDALVDALLIAELDDTVTHVVLDGAGPSFCSGGDLDEFGTTPDLATAHLVRTRAGAALPMARLADRLEVRVHGVCVGAGIELPAYAGRLVAAPDARFLLPEVAMGLLPGAGGTVSIPRRIGRWRTLWLALSGAQLDAATALEWGLVDAVEETAAVRRRAPGR
jgi:enoyl-CoA hydratase/carnithine racemase